MLIARRSIACLGLLLLIALGACRNDLTSERAAEMVRASVPFTTPRPNSVRRELIEIKAVRQIGNHAIEVEFTWRDAPSKDGSVKNGMALFRTDDNDEWKLRGLYKVE